MHANFIEFCRSMKERHAELRPVGFMAAAVLSVVFLACAPARSAEGGEYTHTWTGESEDGVWESPGNWDQATYPDGAADAARINSGADEIAVAGDLTLGALTLEAGYTGTLTLGGTLAITGTGGKSGSLTVDAGTLRTHTSTAAADAYSGNITVSGTFTIGEDGVVVVRRSSTEGEGAGQEITAGTLSVEGVLDADREGFNVGAGPGCSVGVSASGGSHGGRGGGSTTGVTYGSFTNPTALGSGGATYGRGGGAIVIKAGEVINNGTISADSQLDTLRGGAGGSINISAPFLSGSGTIRARGRGENYPGGGGRIALDISEDDTFSGTIDVSGRMHGRRGHAGTVYLSAQKREHLVLGGAEGNMQTLRLGTDDRMGPGGDYNYEFGAITIKDGGTLEIDGNDTLNVAGGEPWGTAAVLHTGALDVQNGGVISADALGFHIGYGPGTSPVHDDGGSYGGLGAKAADSSTYGSIVNPISLGSGANRYGRGGGAVIIVADGAITINGAITANGSATYSRGGSGGTVNISAETLDGTGGTIRASGGGGSNLGGGGRMAILLGAGTDAGSVSLEARGVGGGAAGTVYLEHAGHGAGAGILTVSNPAATAPDILTHLPPLKPCPHDDLRTVTLAIEAMGKVGLTADVTVGDLILPPAE